MGLEKKRHVVKLVSGTTDCPVAGVDDVMRSLQQTLLDNVLTAK